MLPYFISQSNEYTFRTEPTSSNVFVMSLQDMFTLQNSTMSMSGITFEGYESYIAFTGSISSSTIVGSEYRAALYNSGTTDAIWHGTFQCYQSSSAEKSQYDNQIPPVISHASTNEYIIMT